MKIRITRPLVSYLVGIPAEEEIETVECLSKGVGKSLFAGMIWIMSKKTGRPAPLMKWEYEIITK